MAHDPLRFLGAPLSLKFSWSPLPPASPGAFKSYHVKLTSFFCLSHNNNNNYASQSILKIVEIVLMCWEGLEEEDLGSKDARNFKMVW
jgi:hypothetical protein